jgi:hypothetical protein
MTVKVNVSDQEDKSGEYTPLPSGMYKCVIADVEPKASASEKNFGKPMLYFRFTVLEGQYADKTIGTNACLWEGALYTIIGVLKALPSKQGNATAYEDCRSAEGLSIPDAPEFYLTQELMVRRGVNPKTKKENPEDDPSSWIEVRGFAPIKEGSSSSPGNGSAPGPKSTLLP